MLPRKYFCDCKKLLNIGYSHCCSCDQIFVSSQDSHCCICRKIWNTTSYTHCKDCCGIYETVNGTHCCKCKRGWNTKTENHCNDCCTIYTKKGFTHCCKCMCSWDVDSTHCNNCCKIYDANTEKHCCNCKMIFRNTLQHCCKCKLDFPSGNLHCCECKNNKIWNPNSHIHCCKCSYNFTLNADHCCDYNPTAKSTELKYMPNLSNEDRRLKYNNNKNRKNPLCHLCNVLSNSDKNHCCFCFETWNKHILDYRCKCVRVPTNIKIRVSCPRCNFTFNSETCNHCFFCCASWVVGLQNHCCSCNIISEVKNGTHCCKCKTSHSDDIITCTSCSLSYSNLKNHCCKCGVIYECGQKHCCECDFIYNYVDKHCCECKQSYEYSDKHCCKCKINHNFTKQHCCKCLHVYDKEKDHCCDCKTVYNPGFNHCCDCKTVYNPDYNHCCSCTVSWDNNSKHCCSCNSTYELNQQHCCTCNHSWNNDDFHYCDCKKISTQISHCNYCNVVWNDTLMTHCCKCGFVWNNQTHSHCDKKNNGLCHVIEKTQNHCCDCLYETCECSMINSYIESKKKDFIRYILLEFDKFNEEQLSKTKRYHFTEEHIKNLFCINSIAKIKFMHTLHDFIMITHNNNVSIKNSIQKLMSHEKSIIFGFHGNKDPHTVMKICCESWNVKYRGVNGQAYGNGEYFSNRLTTPVGYANNSKIICALILATECKKITMTNETYYIVNNRYHRHYCLPCFTIDCVYHNEPVPKIFDSSPSCYYNYIADYKLKLLFAITGNLHNLTIFCYNHNEKLIYDSVLVKKIANAYKCGSSKIKHVVNKQEYTFNLETLEQINSVTKKIRRIHFEIK